MVPGKEHLILGLVKEEGLGDFFLFVVVYQMFAFCYFGKQIEYFQYNFICSLSNFVWAVN